MPPVHRVPSVGPHEAELSVAVGSADEPAHLAGITHLTEHLLLRLAGLTATFTNGTTELRTVTFTVQGDAEACRGHLARLARAVREVDRLTDEDVRTELRILDREDPLRSGDAVPSPATLRWGVTGAGTAGGSWPTVHALTRHDVVAWVRRWFTAERAVVVLLGSWGADDAAPTVDLPTGGAALDPTMRVPTGRTSPVAVPSAFGGLVLSVVVPVRAAFALALVVEADLFAEVRHVRGLAYEVSTSTTRVDAASVLLELTVGSAPEVASEAAVAVVREARRRADEGFSATARERVRVAAGAALADPAAVSRRSADLVVERTLLGWPSDDATEDLERIAALDAEVLRRAWSDALGSFVLMVDEEADLDGDALGSELGLPVDLLAPVTTLSTREFERASRGVRRWRSSVVPRLAWSSFALSGTDLLVRQGSEAWSVDLTATAVALVRGDSVVLVGDDGRRVNVDASEVRRGSALVQGIVDVVAGFAPERVRRIEAPDRVADAP